MTIKNFKEFNTNESNSRIAWSCPMVDLTFANVSVNDVQMGPNPTHADSVGSGFLRNGKFNQDLFDNWYMEFTKKFGTEGTLCKLVWPRQEPEIYIEGNSKYTKWYSDEIDKISKFYHDNELGN